MAAPITAPPTASPTPPAAAMTGAEPPLTRLQGLRWIFGVQPLVVLALGLWLTWLQAAQVGAREQERARQEVEQEATRLVAGIRRTLSNNVEILRGVAGLLSTRQLPAREDFHAYAETLRLDRDHPGIQGIGFAQWFSRAQLAAHQAGMRAQGMPQYTVRPAGDRAMLSAIVLLEPYDWRNQRAIGFDMFSEPVRRAAMAAAVEEDRPKMSGKVRLVQETDTDVQAGFLIYLPVYRPGAPLATPEQRRAALRGWAYSPLRAGRLMQGFLDREHDRLADRLHLRIYDGTAVSAPALLFDSQPRAGSEPVDDDPILPGWPLLRRLDFEGSIWTVSLTPTPRWLAQQGRSDAQWLVWLTGGALTLLLALLSGLLFDSYRRLQQALARATDSQRALAEQRDVLRAVHEGSPVAIALLDASGCIVQANRRLAEMTGMAAAQLAGRRYTELVMEEQADDASERIADLVLRGHGGQVPRERHFRRADGSSFWAEVNGQSYADADGRVVGVVVSIADITERRDAAERIRHLALHDHLTGLPNRPYFLQRATQALELASRHQRRMALLFIDLDRFKAVNDAHGHDAGDAVLVAIAQRLQALLRASDTVCRHGGDEFIVLLAEVAEAADLRAVARKLVAAIEAPVPWQGQLLQVSASIGVAAYPDHALQLEALVQAADDAMYRAKGSRQQVAEALPPAHDTGAATL